MKTAMLHCTDLFHPHEDPDDHWDLASVFALASRGVIDLRGVVIDYPPADKPGGPAVVAVGQMNYLTGAVVPTAVGTMPLGLPGDPCSRERSLESVSGIRLLLETLRAAAEPIVINIVGSCRDVALAGQAHPDLFAAKCKGIYLNAGTGSPDVTKSAILEYNVSLDPASYASVFQIPCPIYWMPCFEEMHAGRQVREWGTFYWFRQGEILPHLAPRLQNYFLYMLGRLGHLPWLRYLSGEVDAGLLAEQSDVIRAMWCTAGFLHAAGLTVTRDGEIVAASEAGDRAVFRFEPIDVNCSLNGVTAWQIDRSATDRYIFHVLDIEAYRPAMTRALRKLIAVLGRDTP